MHTAQGLFAVRRIAIWSMSDASATKGWAISVTGAAASTYGLAGLDGTIFWGVA